jgi:hypothetical protein
MWYWYWLLAGISIDMVVTICTAMKLLTVYCMLFGNVAIPIFIIVKCDDIYYDKWPSTLWYNDIDNVFIIW